MRLLRRLTRIKVAPAGGGRPFYLIAAAWPDLLGWSLKDLVEAVSDLGSRDIQDQSLAETIDAWGVGERLHYQLICWLSRLS